MARLRVWATREETALITKAAYKQGITVNQFLNQVLREPVSSKKTSTKSSAHAKPAEAVRKE